MGTVSTNEATRTAHLGNSWRSPQLGFAREERIIRLGQLCRSRALPCVEYTPHSQKTCSEIRPFEKQLGVEDSERVIRVVTTNANSNLSSAGVLRGSAVERSSSLSQNIVVKMRFLLDWA